MVPREEEEIKIQQQRPSLDFWMSEGGVLARGHVSP
jgi:hypothetical protein